MAKVSLEAANGATPKFQLSEEQIAALGITSVDIGATLNLSISAVVVGFSAGFARTGSVTSREASFAITEGEIIRGP